MESNQVLPADQPTLKSNKYKKIILLSLLVLTIIAGGLFFFLFQGGTLSFVKIQPQLRIIKKDNIKNLLKENEPKAFYLYLSHDKKKSLFTAISARVVSVDSHTLFEIKPDISPNSNVYQLQIIDNTGTPLKSGWVIPSVSNDNSEEFYIFLPYYPNSFIRLYSAQDKLLWTGRMT